MGGIMSTQGVHLIVRRELYGTLLIHAPKMTIMQLSLPQLKNIRRYHLFCNELNTLTTRRYNIIPSESIQQNAHKKKYWIAAATIEHKTCKQRKVCHAKSQFFWNNGVYFIKL